MYLSYIVQISFAVHLKTKVQLPLDLKTYQMIHLTNRVGLNDTKLHPMSSPNKFLGAGTIEAAVILE
jgi:hypothetical protein